MENSAPPTTFKAGTNDNLDAVRDLLFGSPQPAAVDRLKEIQPVFEEAEAPAGLESLNELEARLNSLESCLKTEADTRIKKEEGFRKTLDQKEALLSERLTALENRLRAVEAKFTAAMQKQSNEQNHSLSRNDVAALLIDLGTSMKTAREEEGNQSAPTK